MKKITGVVMMSVWVAISITLMISWSFAQPKIDKPITPVEPEKLRKPIPPPALALITNARITECSGGTVGPARLVIVWTYGAGLKPEKVTIDVQREGEGSVLAPRGTVIEVSGEGTRREITIWRLWDVPYTLIFKSYYGPWGKRTFTFVKQCGE